MRSLPRLLLLLVAVNLLLLLWNLVRPTLNDSLAGDTHGPAVPLVHVNELPPEMLVRHPLVSGKSDPFRSCLMRGPFASRDDAQSIMLGSGIAFWVEARRQVMGDQPLYRAMIAPSESLEEARVRLFEVKAAIERIGGGVDTYLVTSGPIANAVSLGLFTQQSNALNVQGMLAGEGIEVAVETELRVEESYWVVTNNAEAIDIVDENTGLRVFEVVSAELSENLCEMIAQVE